LARALVALDPAFVGLRTVGFAITDQYSRFLRRPRERYPRRMPHGAVGHDVPVEVENILKRIVAGAV